MATRGWLNICLLIFVLVAITSCDCLFRCSGKVIAEGDGSSLDSVSYYLDSKIGHKKLTDSAGNFKVNEITAGCKKRNIVFEKAGFKQKVISFKNWENKTVELEPL